MPRMPIDTPQRKIASKACAIVHYTLDAEHWLYREETNVDVGRDCVLELSLNDTWNNDKIEGQIKGTKKIKELANGNISFQIDTKTVNYALGSGNSFVLFLVDVETNIIKAMRVLGFKNEFSQKLYDLSKQQWKNGAKGYDEKVTRLIGTYTPKQLFKNNVVYNVFGGSL